MEVEAPYYSGDLEELAQGSCQTPTTSLLRDPVGLGGVSSPRVFAVVRAMRWPRGGPPSCRPRNQIPPRRLLADACIAQSLPEQSFIRWSEALSGGAPGTESGPSLCWRSTGPSSSSPANCWDPPGAGASVTGAAFHLLPQLRPLSESRLLAL